jgi:protein-L-isoaspartate(D-aspartate) O-methyltransferase
MLCEPNSIASCHNWQGDTVFFSPIVADEHPEFSLEDEKLGRRPRDGRRQRSLGHDSLRVNRVARAGREAGESLSPAARRISSHPGLADGAMSWSDKEYWQARQRMCERLRAAGLLASEQVERAFRTVPREEFVPRTAPADVYADAVIPVSDPQGHWRTTSSQPGMMALMLEQLDLRRGHRALEIGTGTGYNAAVMSELVGPEGSVDSVEIDEVTAREAAAALDRVGYSVAVHAADGADGWPEGAPYDRIIATVAVWDLPQPWFDQAAQDARIVAPLTIVGTEYSAALVRDDGCWKSLSLSPCGFVRFRGRLRHPDSRLDVGDAMHPLMCLYAEPSQLPTREALDQWLSSGTGESLRRPDTRERWDGFLMWVLLEHGPRRLLRVESRAGGLGWIGTGLALWDADGMTVLTADGWLQRYGAGATADALTRLNASWTEAGSPPLSSFRLRVEGGTGPPGPGVLPRWTHRVCVELAGD